jgi:hypothetical protein
MANSSAQRGGTSAERGIAIGGIAVAALLGLGLYYLRFCGAVDVPAAPPAPAVMQVDVNKVAGELQANSDLFAQGLGADSERWGIRPPATPQTMGRVLVHRVSTQRRLLQPGKGRVEINGLELEAITRGKTLGLRITNLTDSPVAYRVVTRPDRGRRECARKETWPHNAMALREAGDSAAVVERSECSHRRGKGLAITRVEVIAIERLGYEYLSRLEPSSAGIMEISSNGHRLPPGPACKRTISGPLASALESERTTWRDLIDFYARHNCLQYRFPSDYKAFEGPGMLELPAVDPE